MRVKIIVCGFALFIAAQVAAFAAEPWEPGQSLDTCLGAAITQRPGIITGWRQVGGGEQPPYAVSVLNADGKIGEATCNPANTANLQFKEKTGIFRYTMFERATLAEVRARTSAPQIFVGPVMLLSMELAVALTGKPYYKYDMFLPTGHKATVEIDAAVGRLLKAEVK